MLKLIVQNPLLAFQMVFIYPIMLLMLLYVLCPFPLR